MFPQRKKPQDQFQAEKPESGKESNWHALKFWGKAWCGIFAGAWDFYGPKRRCKDFGVLEANQKRFSSKK